MGIKRPIGRRRFLRDSALCLGARSFGAGTAPALSLAATAGPGAGNPAGGQTGSLQMKANFNPSQVVWIVRQPGSAFEQKFASLELARGLRQLGLASSLVEAAQDDATPSAGHFVFSLGVEKDRFKHPEAYEITHPASERVELTGASSQAVLYAVFDFLDAKARSLAWMDPSTRLIRAKA